MAISPLQVHSWITRAVAEHPTDLSSAFSNQFGVTRATAATWLRKLCHDEWLIRHGDKRPHYAMGPKRLLLSSYAIPGIDESLCWVRDFEPYLDLNPGVSDICHYGFTEMLNNANDHSGGSTARVYVMQTAEKVFIAITDDGIGIFERITQAIHLPDRRMALLELSKGKLTTAPEYHSGEGIFFTSRIFDQFSIVANNLEYTHDSGSTADWLKELDPSRMVSGTQIRMTLPLNSNRVLKDIFNEFAGNDDFRFSKTIVPVRLARMGNENLLSRSQAKRLMQRFDQFEIIILDFDQVPEIGQAFADELFRVFAKSHPAIKLFHTNASAGVLDMIQRSDVDNAVLVWHDKH